MGINGNSYKNGGTEGVDPVVAGFIVFFIFFCLGGGVYWYKNVYTKAPETPASSGGRSTGGGAVATPASSGSGSSGGVAVATPVVRRFPIPPKGAIEFGGMYGTEASHTNPATGKMTCPGKFTPYKIFGTDGQDYSLTVCARKISDLEKWIPTNDSLEFGGMYTGNGMYTNPIAGKTLGCPTGFTSSQVLGFGTENGKGAMDHGLHLCYRKIDDPDTWEPDDSSIIFGGIMGKDDKRYPNPSTGGLTCPTGFETHVTYGKSNYDNPISYCVKSYEY